MKRPPCMYVPAEGGAGGAEGSLSHPRSPSHFQPKLARSLGKSKSKKSKAPVAAEGSDAEEAEEDGEQVLSKSPGWINRQRTLIFCSRGVSYRVRHLMTDVRPPGLLLLHISGFLTP